MRRSRLRSAPCIRVKEVSVRGEQRPRNDASRAAVIYVDTQCAGSRAECLSEHLRSGRSRRCGVDRAACEFQLKACATEPVVDADAPDNGAASCRTRIKRRADHLESEREGVCARGQRRRNHFGPVSRIVGVVVRYDNAQVCTRANTDASPCAAECVRTDGTCQKSLEEHQVILFHGTRGARVVSLRAQARARVARGSGPMIPAPARDWR